jgi:predicted acyl esterase
MRKLVLVSVIFGSLLVAPAAHAIPGPLGLPCVTGGDGVRECGNSSPRTTAPSWDGVPVDVNVALPPNPGTDGNFPLIIVGHGYGGSKFGFGSSGGTDGLRRFTSQGYAVFSMTDRGFHESCGTAGAISAAPAGACDNGFIHLMDDRFEVRDAQFFAGELADEGWVNGQQVGAIGGSYGGGLSMALASLKDREMMADGSLVPWTSPVGHLPMRIAAAAPSVPWTDLAYSLTPNGGTLDYVADSSYDGRIGIEKQSLVAGLYLSGTLNGKYCGAAPLPACTDPEADLTSWKARLDAGEPYDGDPAVSALFNEIKAHHSSYYLDHSEQPAPLLIANGFTDDLFPADEAIRFFNKIRSLYPTAPISLFFGDFGHQRSANKAAESNALNSADDAWLAYYVKGVGAQPFQGATAYAMTCPSATPSGGPFQAGSWAGLARGEVRFKTAASQTISPGGGSSAIDATWDPVTAGQNPCTTASSADQSGVATYRLPAAAGSGYTLLGSPTVIARISSPTANSEVAARILDVDPNGTETLIDRQLFRPAVGTAMQVFQLHPSGHLFAPGHVAKLELLPKDSGDGPVGGYGRPANGQGTVTVSKLELRLPVLESPGAAGNQVLAEAPKALPCGEAIAPEYSSVSYLRASLGDGKVKVKGKTVRVPIDSAPGPASCRVRVQLLGSGKGSNASSAKKHKKKKANVLGHGQATIAGGQSKTVKLKLSKHGRSAVRRGRGIRAKVTTIDSAGNTVQVSKVKLSHKKHSKHKKK